MTWCTRAVILRGGWLGREGIDRGLDHFLGGRGSLKGLGSGEHIASEVAAAFGPLVMLPGEDSPTGAALA